MKRLLPLALLVSSIAFVSAAEAQSSHDRARAKEAYDRGTAAHKRGDFHRAAQEFARADSLAPSPIALQAALDAAIEADDPALGGELVERSQRAAAPPPLAASVAAAKKKFAGRAGRVVIECPPSSKCTASLDGGAIDAKKPAWARTGQHTVVVVVDGANQSREIEVRADATTDVPVTKGDATTTAAPASASSPPPENKGQEQFPEAIHEDVYRDGFPPIVFWVGVGGTALFAGITTVFAFDAKSKHKDFVDSGCEKANEAGCEDKKAAGESARTATNVGLALTLVAGAATAVVGIWFTNWTPKKKTGHSSPTLAPVLAPTAGGGFGGLEGTF